MFAKPQKEHSWLDQLVGEWAVESECQMGPDQPPDKTEGRMSCSSLGGLWLIAEGEGEAPESGTWKSVMTLGYDPEKKHYLGTFVVSVITHLWLYSGSVDESGTKLILDTEGPKWEQEGMARYQDIIKIIDEGHWVMTSQILGEDGEWHEFMSAHHRRIN